MAVLTVDIGGAYIKYALMERSASVLSRGKVETPRGGRTELIDTLALICSEYPETEGIAVALPGIVDSANGYVAMGGALRYNDDFYLRHALYQRCPLPIHIENDAKCAAMAEASLGSLKDVSDGFVLVLGTMIGGAFIKDHRLHRGRHFSAGEVSYIATVRDGLPVAEEVFGNRCGIAGLCRNFARKKGMPEEQVDGVAVFDALDAGDRDAAACLQVYCHELAVQIFNLQTVLDPERIAIGGGISARPELLTAIRGQLERLYAVCPYQIPRAEVVACKFQNDANLIGALQCWLEEHAKK